MGQSDSNGQTNFDRVSPPGQWQGMCRAPFFQVVRLLCAAVRGSGQASGIYGVTGTDFRSSLAKAGAGQGHNLRNGPVRIHALEGWGRVGVVPRKGMEERFALVCGSEGVGKKGSVRYFVEERIFLPTSTGTWKGFIRDSVKIHLMGFLANLAEEATQKLPQALMCPKTA